MIDIYAPSRSMVSVVEACPQFIRMAVVDRALAAKRSLNHLVVHTGQHYRVSPPRGGWPSPGGQLQSMLHRSAP